jgi:hypothetical protein
MDVNVEAVPLTIHGLIVRGGRDLGKGQMVDREVQ